MPRVALVIHNVRSALNVGSLLRTADGLGVEQVYLSGYSPFPLRDDDRRLPHIAARAAKKISKTALGAEKNLNWEHREDIDGLLKELKDNGCELIALEQTADAIELSTFKTSPRIALIVGSEVGGLDKRVIALSDRQVQIPMRGGKESFNVAVAAAIALYHLKNIA